MTDYSRAACLGKADLYDRTITPHSMADYYDAVKEARAVCARCPIREACLVDNADNEGVIGGLTITERTPLVIYDSCGTPAGAEKHSRNREPLCDACRKASTEARRKRRQRRISAICGTDSGYFRHLRRDKNEPCDACKQAHSAAQKARQWAKRDAS